MTDLPVVDGDANGHFGHHNALHQFYNRWRDWSGANPTLLGAVGSTLTLAGSDAPSVSIGTVTGDVTITVDAVGKQVSTLHLVGDGTQRTVTWAGDPLLWAGGTAPTTVPASGRLLVQVADQGDTKVLAIGQEFS